MVDGTEPEVESDLRRRAAWLLAMLAVVAVLFVIVLTQVVGTGGDGGGGTTGPRALDSAAGSASSSAAASLPARTSRPPRSRANASSAPPVSGGRTDCPTEQTCVLRGDVGNAIAAINDYRTGHGQPARPGRVSSAAQDCAVHNGNGCSGGWAETELADPDGPAAVQKILEFGQLLDPSLKDFEVGWAYDPGAKLFYFALIRND